MESAPILIPVGDNSKTAALHHSSQTYRIADISPIEYNRYPNI
jgi:hypothetical protein